MSLHKRLGLLLGSLVSLAAALILLQSQPAEVSQVQIGSLAPNFQAYTLSGKTIRLADLRGAPIIVNFWATWCGPCVQEMPILQSIVDTYAHTGLRVLAVNTGETAAEIEPWRARFDLRYDLLLDEDQRIAASFRLRGQPSTYLIAADGRISHIYYGPVDENTLIAAVETDLKS